MTARPPAERPAALHQRTKLLVRLTRWFDTPMVVLAFAWLALLVVDLVRGLSPFLRHVSYLIWGLFVVQFLLEFAVAPKKGVYLRRQWLTALSLLVPALRVVRVARVVQTARVVSGARLVRVLGSLNRGMAALGRTLGRRGFGFVVALTLLVTLGGAAGMYAFEHQVPGGGLTSYGAALWWTAMIMTTLGSEYWPRTPEGRLLCILLALYAFAVFGYTTATIASFFIDRDAASDAGAVAGGTTINALRQEIAALRAEVRAIGAATVRGE